MKNFLKYGVVPIAIFSFLLVLTVILLPVLINVQKFVPAIEEKVSEAIGRRLSLGPEFGLSLFPSLTLSFSDMKLGNPPGFLSDECVQIDSFEARIKLLPLLKKEIQISRLVVGGLKVNLEKNREGKINWQFIRSMFGRESSANPLSGILRGGVSCTLLAVTDGEVNWIDRTKDARHAVSDLMILLNDVTVDTPIAVDFKAAYDGRPFALEGEIGPLRQTKGDEPLPVEIDFRIVDTVQGHVRGKVANWRTAPVYEATFELASFSPRKLFETLDIPFPLPTADPGTFQSAAIGITAKVDRTGFAVEKGTAQLDDIGLAFSLQAKNIKQPELEFHFEIDRLDLDRYLPVAVDGQTALSEAAERSSFTVGILRPLRDASLSGAAQIESLKVHGATVTDVDARFGGGDGVFTMNPSSMTLYGGQLQANLTADLLQQMPKVRVVLQSQGVQAETLLQEFGGNEFLSGTLTTDIGMEFFGETFDAMTKSLSGEATVSCRDGALRGVDLFRLMHSRKGGGAGQEEETAHPRTEFTELRSVMTLHNGLLDTRETALASPAGTLLISGTADLAERQWDLLVVPERMPATERRSDKSGRLLPLTVTGTFARPEMKIDNRKHPLVGAVETRKANVANLVDEQMPSPIDDDVKNLVGKALVDPAVIAQRFSLQPETIRRGEAKKLLPVGSGRIRIGPLQEESSVR
jgi:AsmA protein